MSELRPHRLYTISELSSLIGRRNIERLRQHGLCALGGRYLGQNVIDAWLQAAKDDWQSRRGLGKAGPDEETTKEAGMGKRNARQARKPLPKPKPGTSLREQLERSRRQLKEM